MHRVGDAEGGTEEDRQPASVILAAGVGGGEAATERRDEHTVTELRLGDDEHIGRVEGATRADCVLNVADVVLKTEDAGAARVP
jgi:hypothetical protein